MNRISSLLALGSSLFMIFSSFLFSAIAGTNISDNMDPLPIRLYLEPAGYAFLIWAFIYIGFVALGIYQAQGPRINDPRFVASRRYMIINSFANACWFLGVLYNQLWVTVICMFVMLYTLSMLSIHLELGKRGADWKEKLYVKLPIALYFGWITLATPINTTSFLIGDLGWTGIDVLGPEVWSSLIMAVSGAIVAYLFINNLVNGTYLMVAIWGLFAIFIANQSDSLWVAYNAIAWVLVLFAILVRYRIKDRLKYIFL